MSVTRKLYVAEPPAAYRIAPPAVIDCSVLSAVLFEEPLRDEAVRQLAGRAMHAPTLLDHEIVSVALSKQARGWPRDSIELALQDYLVQDITLHRCNLSEQADLGRRYGLSAYDAAYLWLADALKAPLVTFDPRLAEAARRHLGSLK